MSFPKNTSPVLIHVHYPLSQTVLLGTERISSVSFCCLSMTISFKEIVLGRDSDVMAQFLLLFVKVIFWSLSERSGIYALLHILKLHCCSRVVCALWETSQI
jgi:hypothetical protein